jgi:predicted DNA-binding protein
MLARMRRATVRISDELDARLRHEAERCGSTVSELIREALEAHLGPRMRRRLVAAAAGASGQDGVSTQVEEIFASEAGQ